MSSKEQFRNSLKREKAVIIKLSIENKKLKVQNIELAVEIRRVRREAERYRLLAESYQEMVRQRKKHRFDWLRRIFYHS